MKKCIACDREFAQHESFKECMNCKFPLSGSIKDAIEYTKKQYKKQMIIFYSAIGISIIILAFLSVKYNEYLEFMSNNDSSFVVNEMFFEKESQINLFLSGIIPYTPMIVIAFIIGILTSYLYIFSQKKKQLNRLNKKLIT